MKSEDVYRTILVRMWGDQKFRSLSPLPPSGQSLWLYLLTGPFSNRIGLFKAGEMALAEELGWDLKAFRKAFEEVIAYGLVKVSLKDRLIFIPNFTKINRPLFPNVVLSWSHEWKMVPECPLKLEAWETIKSNMGAVSDNAFIKAFVKACPKPFIKALPKDTPKDTPIQEQEQEQEHKEKLHGRKSKKLSTDYPEDFACFWSAYPKKSKKIDALKAWGQRTPPLDACLKTLAWQKKSDQWTKEQGRYIPDPATWIRAGQWEDEKPVDPLDSWAMEG